MTDKNFKKETQEKNFKMTPYLEDLSKENRKERKNKKDSEYFETAEDFLKALHK